MSVVRKLTAKIVREAPLANGSSYYVMEGCLGRAISEARRNQNLPEVALGAAPQARS